MIHCRTDSAAAKTGSLLARQFGSENCFAAGTTISAANATSLQPIRFWQRMLVRYKQLDFGSESHFRCSQHNFGSERRFAADNTTSAAKPDSLRLTQIR